MLAVSPAMFALNGTVAVPDPMSCCGVDVALVIDPLTEYWNHTFVSLPFGFTVPGNVALFVVIAEAGEEVTTVGTATGLTVLTCKDAL